MNKTKQSDAASLIFDEVRDKMFKHQIWIDDIKASLKAEITNDDEMNSN